MIITMALILAAGMVSVRLLKPSPPESGRDIIIVTVAGSGGEDLDRRLFQVDLSAFPELEKRGVRFLKCRAPSPWYPSAVASLLTGLCPSEHGLNKAHAHLSLRANTLAEELALEGFRTFAFVEEDSLLDSTAVLQGFHRIETASGMDLVEKALDGLRSYIGRSSMLALIEVDDDRLSGAGGMESALDRIALCLKEERFLDRGVLLVCAPGGLAPGAQRGIEDSSAREFLFLAGSPLGTAPGKVMIKPFSLGQAIRVLRDVVRGNPFEIRDSVREGAVVVTESALPLKASSERGLSACPPYFNRLFFFDDLPFRCFVGPDGAILYQGDSLEERRVDMEEEALVRSRLEAFVACREIVPDLNVSHSAGPILNDRLAGKLSGPWCSSEFHGRRLHAVEHYRLGLAMIECGFSALAVYDFESAMAMDPEFPAAAFELARAYDLFDRGLARTHFLRFLEKFEKWPGQESRIAEARNRIDSMK